MTALLIVWALRIPGRCMGWVLLASVAIDVDHIPDRLGWHGLTAGTPRPYTHSLLTIAIVLILGVLGRRRRAVFFGMAAGLAIHFLRDMAEPRSGVALLWPFSLHSFRFPHGVYLAAMAALAVVAGFRARAGLSEPGPSTRRVAQNTT